MADSRPVPDNGENPDAIRRLPRRRLLLAAIGVLYLFSVPWYRGEQADPPLLFGMPDWVAVALGCYAAVALLNALAWWWTPIEDDERVELHAGDDA